MNYEKFKQIIDLQVAHNKTIDELYKLKIDLSETFDTLGRANDLLWTEVLTENGDYHLCYYLYEMNGMYGTPDLNEEYKDIKELYDYFGVLDTLYPVKRSFEIRLDNKLFTGFDNHCGHCWFCLERFWGFGRYV